MVASPKLSAKHQMTFSPEAKKLSESRLSKYIKIVTSQIRFWQLIGTLLMNSTQSNPRRQMNFNEGIFFASFCPDLDFDDELDV